MRHRFRQADFQTQARLCQHRKDVRLMHEVAAEKEAEAAGVGELDNSVIIEVLRKSRDVADA